MRAGSLDALVARARGAAPVLRPPTPSRFEPEYPQAELTEATYINDAPDPAEHPGSAWQRPPTSFVEPGRPPRGSYQPDMAAERPAQPPAQDNWLVRDTLPDRKSQVPRASGMLDDSAVRTPGLLPYAPSELTGQLMPGLAAEAAMPSGELTVRRYDAAEVAQVPHGTGARGGRPDIADREDAGSEPAIVVHIGRVEVRAVQAPRPPAPAARPQPRAQPSLADYLLARDRGRK
jgi:hypothetical protein